MQGFDGAGAEDLVQDGNFSQELSGDLFEATRELGHVRQGDLEVVTEVRILVTLQAGDDRLEDQRVVVSVNLVDDLVLAFKMD